MPLLRVFACTTYAAQLQKLHLCLWVGMFGGN